MTQFAILRHEYPTGSDRQSHWDLLLEPPKAIGEAPLLHCFAVQAPVLEWDGAWVQKLPDHRRLYLHYEGPIHGDRGAVRRWAAGEIEWLEHSADSMQCNLRATSTTAPPTPSEPAAIRPDCETAPASQETLPFLSCSQPVRCRLTRVKAEQRLEMGLGSFHPADRELDWWRLEWRP